MHLVAAAADLRAFRGSRRARRILHEVASTDGSGRNRDARFENLGGASACAKELSVQLREKNAADRQVLSWARESRDDARSGSAAFRESPIRSRAGCRSGRGPLPARDCRFPGCGPSPPGLPARRLHPLGRGGPRAIEEGADLILLVPIFDTPSKKEFGRPLGPEVLEDLPDLSGHHSEVLAIGGIREEKLPLFGPFRDRLSGVAGIRLFQEAADPRALAERIACQ